MKIICSFCLTPKEVIKEVGSFRKLECNHLVAYKPERVFIEEDIPSPKVEEEKKEEKEPEFLFKNSKTGHTPYPFQLEGINFAEKAGFRCLIGDEMGLGKTVQALGIIKKHPELAPILIIVKSSIKMQWMVNLINWCGFGYIPQVIETGKTPPVEGFNAYICSYDIIRRFSTEKDVVHVSQWGHQYEAKEYENIFYTFPFKTVILDEVQAIKGESRRTEEVKKICQGKKVIALSGTPIKNNAVEYFTILNMLNPDKFPTKKGYISRWVNTEIVKGYEKHGGLVNPERFKEYTKDFIIRRTREEVADEIALRVTGANRLFYHVDFESDKLKRAYEKEEAEFIREMEREVGRKNPVDIIARIQVMRHLVGLNKIQPTVDYLAEYLMEHNRKIIVGCHHKDVMESMHLLTTKLCQEGAFPEPLLFHSSLSTQERFDIVKRFTEGQHRIMFCSTLAMGEGVDGLQHNCYEMILAERQWNPANEEQFESRLVRMGQKSKTVDATYMVATGTIDEYFCEIVEAKRKWMAETLDGKTYDWEESSLIQELYNAILVKGRKRTKRGF